MGSFRWNHNISQLDRLINIWIQMIRGNRIFFRMKLFLSKKNLVHRLLQLLMTLNILTRTLFFRISLVLKNRWTSSRSKRQSKQLTSLQTQKSQVTSWTVQILQNSTKTPSWSPFSISSWRSNLRPSKQSSFLQLNSTKPSTVAFSITKTKLKLSQWMPSYLSTQIIILYLAVWSNISGLQFWSKV